MMSFFLNDGLGSIVLVNLFHVERRAEGGVWSEKFKSRWVYERKVESGRKWFCNWVMFSSLMNAIMIL